MSNKQLVTSYLQFYAKYNPNLPLPARVSVRSRISLIRNHPGRRSVQKAEWPVFAAMLGRRVEELVGANFSGELITVETPSDPTRYAEFQRQFQAHLVNCEELMGWAEYFPCSLETEALMEGHHRSLFDYDGDETLLAKYLEDYRAIGNSHRKRFLAAGPQRPWLMTHMIFQSDLEKIADMACDNYRCCTREVRLQFFDSLITLVADESWKLNLVIINDKSPSKNVHRFRQLLHDFDAVVVLIDKKEEGTFAFWRNHWGDLAWAANPDQADTIRLRLRWLHDLKRLPGLRSDFEKGEVIDLLQSCKSRLASKRQAYHR